MSGWDKVKDLVSGAAPMLGGLIGGPVGATAGKLIANALGTGEDPDAIAKAMQSDPEAALKLQRMENEHARELRRMSIEAESNRQAELHATIRKELETESIYKSGWRPMIGWVLAFALAAIMGTLAYAIAVQPAKAAEIMGAASTVLVFMAGLLGYNAKKRSDDKALKAGIQPKGIGDAIAGIFSKR